MLIFLNSSNKLEIEFKSLEQTMNSGGKLAPRENVTQEGVPVRAQAQP